MFACATTPARTLPNVPVLEPTDALKAELNKPATTDGSIQIVRVTLPPEMATLPPTDLRAEFADHEIPLYRVGGDSSVYEGVVPIPYLFAPGEARVVVRLGRGASEKSFSLAFQVEAGKYKTEELKVKPKHVNPPDKEGPRIKREVALVAHLYDRVTRIKHWDGPFALPIQSEVTSPFGGQRLYNGELKNYHGGTDLKAPTGTPIKAAAKGEVVMAQNLYYTGNTVLLDHGYGVFTLYAHMSKLKVRKGQLVPSGALLGLSGMTGRVTGPHLHWQAIVRHVKVDPMELTRVMR